MTYRQEQLHPTGFSGFALSAQAPSTYRTHNQPGKDGNHFFMRRLSKQFDARKGGRGRTTLDHQLETTH
jgi:hypothetical protein